MIGFPARRLAGDIDDHRAAYGVEPICRVLPTAPSTYHEHVTRRADPSRLPPRAQCDAGLQVEIKRVFEENLGVYGVRKVWRQLRREGLSVARCTVARLMRGMGLSGVIRGKPARTTVSDKAAPCPLDRVNRQFQAPAPNTLWVAEFTYVSTSAFRTAKSPGQGSSTWPLSLTPTRGALSGGGSAARPTPGLCWMHWGRPCTSGGRLTASWSITRTGGRNTYRFGIPSA